MPHAGSVLGRTKMSTLGEDAFGVFVLVVTTLQFTSPVDSLITTVPRGSRHSLRITATEHWLCATTIGLCSRGERHEKWEKG